MILHKAGDALLKLGLATHNTGDVDVQTVAGAIGTGPHGNGPDKPCEGLKELATDELRVRSMTDAPNTN